MFKTKNRKKLLQIDKNSKSTSKIVFIQRKKEPAQMLHFFKKNKLLMIIIIVVILAIICVLSAIYILFPFNRLNNSYVGEIQQINKPLKTISEYTYLPSFYDENKGFVIKGSQMTVYNHKADEKEKKINLPFVFTNLSNDNSNPSYGWVDNETIFYTTAKNIIIFDIENQKVKELEDFFDDVLDEQYYLQNICYNNEMFAYTISLKDESFFNKKNDSNIISQAPLTNGALLPNSTVKKESLEETTSKINTSQNISDENVLKKEQIKNNIKATGVYNAIKNLKGKELYCSNENIFFVALGENRYSSIGIITNVYYSTQNRKVKILDEEKSCELKNFDKYSKTFSETVSTCLGINNTSMSEFEILSLKSINKKIYFLTSFTIAEEKLFYYQVYDLSKKNMETYKIDYKPLNFADEVYSQILPSGNLVINFKTEILKDISPDKTIALKFTPQQEKSENGNYIGKYEIIQTEEKENLSLDNDTDVFYFVAGAEENIVFIEFRNTKTNIADYFEKSQKPGVINNDFSKYQINENFEVEFSNFKRSNKEIDRVFFEESNTEYNIINNYNKSYINFKNNGKTDIIFENKNGGLLFNPVINNNQDALAVFCAEKLGVNNYYVGKLIILKKTENGNWEKSENQYLNTNYFYFDNVYINKNHYFWDASGEHLAINFDNENSLIYFKDENDIINLKNKEIYFENKKGVLLPLEMEFSQTSNEVLFLSENDNKVYLNKITLEDLYSKNINDGEKVILPTVLIENKYSNPLSICFFDEFKVMIIPQTASQNFQGIFVDYAEKTLKAKSLEYKAFGGAASKDKSRIMYGVLLEDNKNFDISSNINETISKTSEDNKEKKYYVDTYVYDIKKKEYFHFKTMAKEFTLSHDGKIIFSRSLENKHKYLMYNLEGQEIGSSVFEKYYGAAPRLVNNEICINK